MKCNECIFCKIIKGDIESATIFENNEFKVLLDRFPATKGHILVIPKEHVDNIFEIDPEKAGRLFALAVQLSKVLKKEFSLEGLNIVQNNGQIAGQTVMHFHLHIIPRYSGDEVQVGWKPQEVTEEQLAQITQKLKAAL